MLVTYKNKKNPEKAKAANKAWYEKNTAKAIAASKRYVEKNKVHVKKRQRIYTQKNYSKILKRTQKRREENRQLFWSFATIASHRHRGYIVEIKSKWLETLARKTKRCFLCGVKLAWHAKESRAPLLSSPSLDRINNTKVLKENTVQIICQSCNVTKGSRTMAQFIRYCKRVAKKYAS